SVPARGRRSRAAARRLPRLRGRRRRRPRRPHRRHAGHRAHDRSHRARARGGRPPARYPRLRGAVVAGVSRPDFWDALYAAGGDGWELGAAAPPLVDVVERTPPPRGRAAVLGCGRGHDARLLAARGYEVVGYDFSTAAVEAGRALA